MEIDIIKHKDILFSDLLRIIRIKNASWSYPLESQISWIIKNQRDEDKHVILKENSKDLAYLMMCPVNVVVNGKSVPFVGIGNVCSVSHSMGYGGILMQNVNAIIVRSREHGILFCKEKVKNFYEHYGWKLVPDAKVISQEVESYGLLTMVYNIEDNNTILYKGRIF